MIIVCTGCSFTHGMELWEEKFVPGYKDIDSNDKSLKISRELSVAAHNSGNVANIDSDRRELSYTGFLKKNIPSPVINIGKGGQCQQESVLKAIKKIAALRVKFPEEKLVCILQDTSPDRAWLWQAYRQENLSQVIPNLEKYYEGSQLDAYEIKHAFMEYEPREQQHSEYYLQTLALQNFCIKSNVDFLHFRIWNNQHDLIEDSLNMTALRKSFFDNKYSVNIEMVARLHKYYGNDDFYLPGRHVNCESHKLIGAWLIEEMKERNII